VAACSDRSSGAFRTEGIGNWGRSELGVQSGRKTNRLVHFYLLTYLIISEIYWFNLYYVLFIVNLSSYHHHCFLFFIFVEKYLVK